MRHEARAAGHTRLIRHLPTARGPCGAGREPQELREHGIAGTRAEVEDLLGRLAEDGVERVYLQVLDLSDLDHLDEIASFTGVRPVS